MLKQLCQREYDNLPGGDLGAYPGGDMDWWMGAYPGGNLIGPTGEYPSILIVSIKTVGGVNNITPARRSVPCLFGKRKFPAVGIEGIHPASACARRNRVTCKM